MQTTYQTQHYLEKVSTNISDAPTREEDRKPKFFLFFLAILAVGTIIFMANEDFLVERDGKTDLAPWRKGKLMKKLEDMEEGEQYALVVRNPGIYPCYPCIENKEIYLNAGEIWKYGVTSKGEKGRYQSGLPVNGLVYVTEYVGLLRECYRREKIQIYNYAILPENLRRSKRLIRPPGNKQDN